MSDNDLVVTQTGLSPEEEMLAWELYERHGSMDAVAKKMGIRPYLVKAALCRDQIRLIDTQTTRAEAMAQRWEDNEIKLAGLTNQMLDVLTGMLKHIKQCMADDVTTDLVNMRYPDKGKMSPTEAYQWLLEQGMIDSLSKSGINAAKISEGMRLLAFDKDNAKGSNRKLDPSTMSNEELWGLVADMEGSGRPLPWGVAQWRDAQIAKRARVPGTGS